MARQIIDSDAHFSRTLQEYILHPGLVQEKPIDSVDLTTHLMTPSMNDMKLNTPILTAAMQSVTGPKMAVAIAKLGGAGVIYCSQPIENQAGMVKAVKRIKAGFVVPETLSPKDSIQDAVERMKRSGYSKFPVTSNGTSNGELVGMLTDNDFDPNVHSRNTVAERMVPRKNLAVAFDHEINDDIKVANRKIRDGHHSVLPIVDRNGKLKSLVFRKDVNEHENNPRELLDGAKRYVVGAAINTHDYKERTAALASTGVDFLVIDTSQGYSEYVKKTLGHLQKYHSDVPVIGGNVITADGFKFLVENGAHAVKVGMGSGSICITQEQIRVGRGQASAVNDVANARDVHVKETGDYIPICSDGGIMNAGDILVALALGADYVMMGGYIAGTEESNGPETIIRRSVDDRPMEMRGKEYWGEGSRRAREWSGKRYGHNMFVEGFDTVVHYAGTLKDRLNPALAQVRDGMRKSGSYSIPSLQMNAVLQVLSPLSITLSRNKPSG